MLGLKETPSPDYKCNDKFLIVALPCLYELGNKTVSESWAELESKYKTHSISKKIKVKYVINEPESITPQPVLAADEERKKITTDESEKKVSEKLDEVSAEDRSKIDTLNEKLDSTASALNTKTVAPTQSTSSSMTNLILIAFIVLIISWLLF